MMLQTIEAVVDENGTLRMLEPIQLPKLRRVLITILNEEPSDETANLALLSELALARDWERPEEEEAWSHLAQLPSL
jgi:predicted DNA-binding antitoxin AbrB/MazE fold protein